MLQDSVITSQQACIHGQGAWAEHYPCSPDMVPFESMKDDAGSCHVILLSLAWSKVLLRLLAAKLCIPKTLWFTCISV